jgi:D-alanyl-D-alanine carboxypeptidase/D-alanyl-D-alanine-endopeptidase (penicillin-binding protein 4)
MIIHHLTKHGSCVHISVNTLFSFLLLAFSSLTYAQAISEESINGKGRIALAIQSDQTSLVTNQDMLMPPASTLKLFTALAAKLELGDGFKFHTRIEKAGNDIIVRFGGDPTLTQEQLKAMLLELKQVIGTTIRGDIWLDDSAFTGYEFGVGWPWDILGVCYSAPSSAITLDHNCFPSSIRQNITVKNNKDKQYRVYIPEQYPVTLEHDIKAVTKEQQKQSHCDLELQVSHSNHYTLSGCLPPLNRALPLNFAVKNPAMYTQKVTKRLLREVGIHLQGKIHLGKASYASSKVLVAHASAPLNLLLEEMLKESDNLIANNLLKTLGQHFFMQAGSFSNGAAALKQILLTRASIDLSTAQIFDGSGLSRNNRITVNQLVQVLTYIWQHDNELNYITMLPKSGESGTLRYRKSMRKPPVQGRLAAKSGSLYGSFNMAGFVLDSHNQPSALFVQLVSDYFIDEQNREVDSEALAQFEQRFYLRAIEMSEK